MLTGAINAIRRKVRHPEARLVEPLDGDRDLAPLSPERRRDLGCSITNIMGDGHTVTYAKSNAANSKLGGKTYALAGGGGLGVAPVTGGIWRRGHH